MFGTLCLNNFGKNWGTKRKPSLEACVNACVAIHEKLLAHAAWCEQAAAKVDIDLATKYTEKADELIEESTNIMEAAKTSRNRIKLYLDSVDEVKVWDAGLTVSSTTSLWSVSFFQPS